MRKIILQYEQEKRSFALIIALFHMERAFTKNEAI